ncbi:hypothetical protein E2C01_093944 [Portunus trituberculatus]|uniref:Uncharacterized protein n=1 Tax=Portunus trituberculatus TaxID=210409 RepID=A0A5B7JP42_PORTR|nr:hypothetical protein [Portunus trituberculatus]
MMVRAEKDTKKPKGRRNTDHASPFFVTLDRGKLQSACSLWAPRNTKTREPLSSLPHPEAPDQAFPELLLLLLFLLFHSQCDSI